MAFLMHVNTIGWSLKRFKHDAARPSSVSV